MMMWYVLCLFAFSGIVLGLCMLSEVLWELIIWVLPIIEKIERRFTKN